MIEMNKKPTARENGRRKRLYSQPKSPTYSPGTNSSSKTATATPTPTPTSSSSSSLPAAVSSNYPLNAPSPASSRLEKPTDNTPREHVTPTTKESSVHAKVEASSLLVSAHKEGLHSPVALNSHLMPFKSSSLPEEKTNHTPPVLPSISRKRERSPSPTVHLDSKRPSSLRDMPHSWLNTTSFQVLAAKVSVPSKVSSPVPSGRLIAGSERSAKAEGPGVMSPTQRMLSEEILRQEEKKNHKLKGLIVRELRKPAKSESIKCSSCFVHRTC